VRERHASPGVLIAVIRDPGKGPLKGLGASRPPQLPSWTTLRMVRSGPWDAQAVITDVAAATRRALLPPPDGVRYLLGDRTCTPQRGRQHPVGHGTRHGEHAPYRRDYGGEILRYGVHA
jgi:hypothetical protein